MKVKQECASCGSHGKRKVVITLKPEDRDTFLAFTEFVQQQGRTGIIPPSKYPKNPLLIPSPGENPCGHCKFGEDLVGPSGCGRGKTCLAYAYFQLHQLGAVTGTSTTEALKDFTCAVPDAHWLSQPQRKAAARSAAIPFGLKQKSFSVPEASSKRRAPRKSKPQK